MPHSSVPADSHSLQHACRISVVRRMIFFDQWDSEAVERLHVPNIVKEYLKFMEYGAVGDIFRRVVHAERSYWNGTMTASELRKVLMKLDMKWTHAPQNQQNDLCVQRRLRLTLASILFDQSSLSAQRRLWADRVDAYANLSLRWAHSHFACFFMPWLK